MKQGVNKILTIFLLLLYIATGLGVGIHHCDDDNTSYLFSLFVSSECDDIHPGEHNIIVENVVKESCSCTGCPPETMQNSGSDTKSIVSLHDADCCVDEILTLELAQLNPSSTNINTLDLPFFSVIATVFNFSIVEGGVQNKCIDTSVSIFNLRHFLTVISVWII